MGEVIRFVPRSERERVRTIQEARAIYESIFPQEQRDKAPISQMVGSASARGGDEGLLS